MRISDAEIREVTARDLSITDDSLTVDLAGGRTITAPIAWFPRLENGTASERANWRLIGNGEGIHLKQVVRYTAKLVRIGEQTIWRALTFIRPSAER